MTHDAHAPAARQEPMGRVAVASLIGTTIEFFDFYAYGIAAALVLNTAFFPELSETASTLAAFSTFAVAFLARPIGSMLFGHFGDRIGRKSVLIVSLLLMGLSTVAIGLVPDYGSIGLTAAVILVVLRVLQGIGLGGEWGGAALLATEHAPEGKRGFYGMFPQLGPAVGFIAANAVFLVVRLNQDAETFATWGWRVPFVSSIVLVLIGLWIRVKISETPVFQRVMDAQDQARIPVLDVFRHEWRHLLLGAGVMTIQYTLFYTATTYCLAYGTRTLRIPQTTMLTLTMLAVLALAAGTIVSSPLSDRVGRKKVIVTACAASIVWGPAMFPLMNTGNLALIWLALAGALGIMGLCFGPMAAFLPELFPTRFRYSGAGMAYSIGGILGGSLPPLVATALQAAYGSTAVGLFVAAVGAISLACALAVRETVHRGLDH